VAGYDLFLSYSHHDSDFVSKLDVALRANGLKVFLDKRDIRYGDLVADSVSGAIAEAAAQLVVVSATSVQSAWVRHEIAADWTRAIESDFRVIPVVVDDAEVPPTMSHLRYLELRRWKSDAHFREGVGELLHTLGRHQRSPENPLVQWALRHVGKLRPELDAVSKALTQILDQALTPRVPAGPPRG
jgi:hypothetical protein